MQAKLERKIEPLVKESRPNQTQMGGQNSVLSQKL